MLTKEQILQNKEKYLELLSRIRLRTPEFEEFLKTINYFEAPATASHAGAYRGGLAEYALKLAHELGILCNAYFPGKYTEEDVLKVALLKDLYRSIMYEPYLKNVKNDATDQWEKILAYRTKEDRPTFGNIGFSSYMLIKQFTNLTDEQVLAICYSNSIDSSIPDIHEIKKEYPLVVLTKMATEATNYF